MPKGINRIISKYYFQRIAIHNTLTQLNKLQPIQIVEWPDAGGLFLKPIPGITDVLRNHGPLMSHRLLGLIDRNKIIEEMELHTLTSIPNWIGVSEWFMNEWINISGAKPTHKEVIYNPVDTDLFSPILGKQEELIILYAGSLLERKGVFQLAKASNTFLRIFPRAKLMIVGRDFWGGCDRLEKEIDISVRNQVYLMYPVPQDVLAILMRKAAIFAMPSFLESFGNVWAEAMSAGLPVVGSKLSCGPEIVPDKKAGLLVNPNNIEEISDVISYLLASQKEREKLGIIGREIAIKKFSKENSVNKTEQFYKRCIF
jgi:glycosyltransferase involved in cell wall biosynthesis